MSEGSRWNTVLPWAAALVFVAGCAAWVFPLVAADYVGAWALPLLSVAALVLAVVVTMDWRWLRGFVLVLAATLIAAWLKAPQSATSTGHFAGASLGLLLMMMLGCMVDTQNRLRLVMAAFLCLGLVVMMIGLAATPPPLNPSFAATVFGYLPDIRLGLAGLEPSGHTNPNGVAALVLLVAPVGASVLFFRSSEKVDQFGLQPAGLVVTATSVIVLAICHSRLAWIAVWLTMATTLLLRGAQQRAWRLVIGIPVVALPFAAIGVSSLTSHQFLSKTDSLWASMNTRIQIMTAGAERFRESPWLGVGMNQFHIANPGPTQSGYVAHAHNIFLQTGLDLGVFGLLAYCCVLGFLLIRAHEASLGPAWAVRSASVGAALSLVAVTIFGFGDAVALGAKVGLFQWMAAGLILGAWRTQLALKGTMPSPRRDTSEA